MLPDNGFAKLFYECRVCRTSECSKKLKNNGMICELCLVEHLKLKCLNTRVTYSKEASYGKNEENLRTK